MIDYSSEIKSALSAILPTYYELFCDATTAKPCITYMAQNNWDDATGNTLGYSRLRYTIKLWGDDLAELVPDSLLVDAEMRHLGFKRVSANDLVFDNHICKIFAYEAFGKEYY